MVAGSASTTTGRTSCWARRLQQRVQRKVILSAPAVPRGEKALEADAVELVTLDQLRQIGHARAVDRRERNVLHRVVTGEVAAVGMIER